MKQNRHPCDWQNVWRSAAAWMTSTMAGSPHEPPLLFDESGPGPEMRRWVDSGETRKQLDGAIGIELAQLAAANALELRARAPPRGYPPPTGSDLVGGPFRERRYFASRVHDLDANGGA
jgi:hypothetical protein